MICRWLHFICIYIFDRFPTFLENKSFQKQIFACNTFTLVSLFIKWHFLFMKSDCSSNIINLFQYQNVHYGHKPTGFYDLCPNFPHKRFQSVMNTVYEEQLEKRITAVVFISISQMLLSYWAEKRSNQPKSWSILPLVDRSE